MDSVNKTLYIPLYGKSYVSKKGIILNDKMAEEMWTASGFTLRGKAASKWLAYYMGMRARVFDDWAKEQIKANPDATILHLGCGLDSRIKRVGMASLWYDVDFPEVIAERKKYFTDGDGYTVLPCDIRDDGWVKSISGDTAIVIMEGISMYLTPSELSQLIERIYGRFNKVNLLMDCYTTFAAKMSKIKNPINEVGVTTVYGMDDPDILTTCGMEYVKEHSMTPVELIDMLPKNERKIFNLIYAGRVASNMYRLYEYKK